MATYTLTPKSPDPITGLQTAIRGWHFTGATFSDVYEGMTKIRQGGWLPIIDADPADTTNTLWRMQIARGGFPPFLVHNTDWFTFDGYNIRVITQSDVESNYDIS